MIARPRKLWLFRLLAVLLAMLPFLIAEVLCYAFGWGCPSPQLDPFVGFSGVQPLFEPSPDGQRLQIAQDRLKFFAAESFPATKPPDTLRIFCLGGSTVQGRPYSIPTAFSTWMKLALETADPQTTWDVVNCGGISYASYRLIPILKEVLAYEPDLIILCTGHNEFLEDRSYAHIKQLPTASLPPLEWLLERRLVVIGSRWLQATHKMLPTATTSTGPAELLPAEVDAILDYRDGLATYHRDPKWQADVRKHFEFNLRHMIALCREANVPLLLLQPPSNLRGQPPFKSDPTAGLSSTELAAGQQWHQQGVQIAGQNPGESVRLLQRAVLANPDEARWWYQLGQMQFLHGELAASRDSLVRARDLDICPLRMTSPLENTLQTVAKEHGTPFSNLHTLLEQQTTSGILGDDWLVDHVHPGFDGHRLIGIHLVDQLAEHGWCKIHVANWKELARARFAEHFASLDRPYFHRGQRMLQSLQGWAAGRAAGPPADQRFPHRSPSKIPPASN